MFKHYVKVARRLIKRSFLFSSINMLGFVLGMTAAFLIYLWVVDELTFEDFQKDADSIYRVVTVDKFDDGRLVKKGNGGSAALSNAFRKEFPQVEDATFIRREGQRPFFLGEKQYEADVAYVDTTFFRFFSFPVLSGDPNRIHTEPASVVISDRMARKLFGTDNAVGKEFQGVYYGPVAYYKVAAVIAVPRKSHIQADIFFTGSEYLKGSNIVFGSSWGPFTEALVYIKMGNIRMTYADRKRMSLLMKEHTGDDVYLMFQPLKEIHLHTNFEDVAVRNHGSLSLIWLFSALALLVIFMGAFNFTTLSTARASLRFREIGARKVCGAKRHALVMQFLSESIVQAFLSLVLALALTELLLPFFNMFVGKDIRLVFSWEVVWFILLGILGIGVLAGSYPALYMSSLNPLLAFKGGKISGKKGDFIKGLVCVQFFIAILLVICTSVIFKQLYYMQHKDLGLDKENVVSVKTNLWYEVDAYKKEVLKNPNVKSVSMGTQIDNYLEGYDVESLKEFTWQTNDEMSKMKAAFLFADGDFVKTYGIQILKGEAMKSDYDAYWRYENRMVMINETAWKQMHVEDPIGIETNLGKIVGVVKDFNFSPLRKPILPVCIFYTPENMYSLHFKIAPENKAETIRFLKELYERMNPGQFFTYEFFDDALSRTYAPERQQGYVSLIFTFIAILIAMMGVFGLVALSAQQRTKEIGIRKVNGAHTERIVKMFCREYMLRLAIAFVVACPVAYFLMHNWLAGFAYRTTLSWWLFPLAGLIILLITLLTVIGQSYRSASQNPVKSLRYE